MRDLAQDGACVMVESPGSGLSEVFAKLYA